jgi:hypothetical protein
MLRLPELLPVIWLEYVIILFYIYESCMVFDFLKINLDEVTTVCKETSTAISYAKTVSSIIHILQIKLWIFNKNRSAFPVSFRFVWWF